MKILYYDCFTGISGDMNLGSLIDLGVPLDHIVRELNKIELKGYDIQVEKSIKNGISGTLVKVQINNKHNEQSKHDHGHGHHHNHEHNHRTFTIIKKLINSSTLSESIKKNSIGVFELIARAEGKIHNKPVEEVHFHEVGAIDSVVDIVSAAVCIDYLKPDKIMASTVELGSGFVECAHGTFPVPAPATMEILKDIPTHIGGTDKETTTPTGAAILAHFVDEFSDVTNFKTERIGYGLGYYDLKIPNVLRTYWAEAESKSELLTAQARMIECNIDDMSPEYYDYLINKIISAGAQDVFLTPIIMKKSRPANKLSILAPPEKEDSIIDIVLNETTTIGVRKYTVDKTMLDRKTEIVKTPYGDIRVKIAYKGEQLIKYKAEYDDCRQLAEKLNVPVADILKSVDDNFKSLKDD